MTSIKVGKLDRALTVDGLSGLGTSLLAWLQSRRWFGSKAAATAARVIDVVRLPWADGALGIAIAEVDTAEGKALYQVPLALRVTKAPGIARLEGEDGPATLLDAVEDPVFQTKLCETFLKPSAFPSEKGGEWRVERVGAASPSLSPQSKITVGSAEQSNSSLIYDQTAFFKLYRKLERGIQPDVEMTRFLTVDAAFPHVATLYATVAYRDSAGEATAGMLLEYLSGARDAWTHVLDSAGRPGLPRAERGVPARDIEQLGKTTREMHEALSGAAAAKQPDFAPVPAK